MVEENNGNDSLNFKNSNKLREFEKLLASNVETYSASKKTFDTLIFSKDR
jgi:hypothetical protein